MNAGNWHFSIEITEMKRGAIAPFELEKAARGIGFECCHGTEELLLLFGG